MQNNLTASELRIGNIVEYYIKDSLDPRKAWWEINIIDADDIKYLSENPDCKDYRALKITKELLLDFGIDFFWETEYYYIEFTIKGLLFQTTSEGFGCDICHDSILIKYAHQLQNLYFGLSNTELTIKE